MQLSLEVQISWSLTSFFTLCLVNFRPLTVLLVGLLPSGSLRVLLIGLPPRPRRLSSSSSLHKPKPRAKNVRSFTDFPSLFLVHGTPLNWIEKNVRHCPPQRWTGYASALPSFILATAVAAVQIPGLGARPYSTPHQGVCTFVSQATLPDALLLLYLLALSTLKRASWHHGKATNSTMPPHWP